MPAQVDRTAVEHSTLLDLERRAREAIGLARAGKHPYDLDRNGASLNGSEIFAVAEQLGKSLAGLPPRDPKRAAELCELLVELTEVQQDLDERSLRGRFDSVSRVYDALARLREIGSLAELIDKAPEEVCHCMDFDRAVISRIRGSVWIAETWAIGEGHGSRALSEYLRSAEIPLSPGLLETELLRRRAPALVTDPLGNPRTHRDLMTVMQTRAYVAAPIMPAGRVIGFIHADAFGSGRALTTEDRDKLGTFAEGFGLIFERMVLVERLAKQRERIASAFKQAEQSMQELCNAEVRLAHHQREEVAAVRTAASVLTGPQPRIETMLTPREREVIPLMAAGATNREIANQLVISEGTVKSHVKHVLHKLRASNRAEAVSRYLHLAMKDQP